MITFTTIGRNDNYGGNFLNNLYRSLEHNLKEISKLTENFEYILVDWVSIDVKLYQLDQFNLLSKQYPQLKIYNVEPSVAINEGLSTDVLYEYFAKNLGIRKSNGNFIVVLNSDLLLSSDLIENFISLSNEQPIPHIFRPKYSVGIRTNSDLNTVVPNIKIFNISEINQYLDESFNFKGDNFYETIFPTIDFLNEKIDPMKEIASGDIIASHSLYLKNIIKGYDETNIHHRQKNKRQSGMDSEMIYNYTARGMPVFFLENLYFHIEHSRKDLKRDNVRQMYIWNNSEDWGFIKYETNQLTNNIYQIK